MITASTTHGLSHTPEYGIWGHINSRCTNPNDNSYQYYGARGIKVCERWRDFQKFYEDMGPRPSVEHTIERLDFNKDYTPDNCIWLHNSLQSKNRRGIVNLTFQGKTLSMTEWAREMRLNKLTLFYRLQRGWSVEEALTTPISKRPKKAPVIQLTLSGEFIRRWESTQEAARTLGIVRQCIITACKHGYNSHGFQWKYDK